MRTCVVSRGAHLLGYRLMIVCKGVKRACLAPQVGRLEPHQLARNLIYDTTTTLAVPLAVQTRQATRRMMNVMIQAPGQGMLWLWHAVRSVDCNVY